MAKKGYKIGIDLGTANTLVYINGHGIIFNEPSVVAVDRKTNKCIAVGHIANAMLGKGHEGIKVVRPLEGGVIADLDACKANLEFIFKKLDNINVDFKKSTLLICCPSEISTIEKVALKNLAVNLGISDVFIEQEVKAGAIGAGIDIFAPKGSMIIDIGGGSTDIGVLALGDLVVWDSVRIAGNYFDNEILKYVKVKYNIAIGQTTAEKIKINLGTLRRVLDEDKEYTFAGRHIKTGIPSKAVIKQSEIRTLFLTAFEAISNKVIKVLQETPPELSSDIYNSGIYLNGGGALIDGAKEYFESTTGLKVTISPNALTAIVEGTKFLLKNRGNYLVKPLE
ncbi:MAG: cell shape determining protein MreB/Mrl [Haloplasmataceae bacterium]|jgi:rod shape-determining protein MreB|nr:cell shape determining protein MreB/Mrl [Haloplasmataceae bacterium]